MENEKKLKFNPDDMIAAADEQFLEWMKNGRYAELIDTMPNLGRYSLRNQMLILMQNPKATFVNGMNAWNYKRRHVQKVLRSETRVAGKILAGDKVLNGELRRDLAFLARQMQANNLGG